MRRGCDCLGRDPEEQRRCGMGMADFSRCWLEIKTFAAIGEDHQEVPQASLLGEDRRLSVWLDMAWRAFEEGMDNPHAQP